MVSNRETGDAFHRLAQSVLQELTGLAFAVDVPIPVGRPPRDHKFDFATADRSVIGECKCYTWTESDNAPSAKIGHLKEALQYLHELPGGTKTFILMKRHCRRHNGEPLADYFARLNDNMLGDTAILELCGETGKVRTVHGKMI